VRLDAERFAAIRRVMRARCTMSTNSTSGVLRYLPIPTTRQVVLRGGDEIVERLRRRAAEPLEDRVLAVVRWLQEATVEQVHELITAADPLPFTSPNDDAPARPIEERAAEIVDQPGADRWGARRRGARLGEAWPRRAPPDGAPSPPAPPTLSSSTMSPASEASPGSPVRCGAATPSSKRSCALKAASPSRRTTPRSPRSSRV
jgi:hypothetical protein